MSSVGHQLEGVDQPTRDDPPQHHGDAQDHEGKGDCAEAYHGRVGGMEHFAPVQDPVRVPVIAERLKVVAEIAVRCDIDHDGRINNKWRA